MFKPRLQAAATSEALGIADIRCPFEQFWRSESKIAPVFVKQGMQPIQSFILLSLIREALYLALTNNTSYQSEHLPTFAKELRSDKTLLVDKIISEELARTQDAQTAWKRVANKLASDPFRNKIGLKVSWGDADKVAGSIDPYLQRLPAVFAFVFEAFRAAENGFEVDGTTLVSENLSDLLAKPL